jgi:biopolymer transport protein ExbD
MSLYKHLKNHSDHEEGAGGHDWPFLVPMLDLVFILLFFFIIMSNSAQYVFDIKLPRPDSSYEGATQKSDGDLTIKLFVTKKTFMIDKTEFTDFNEFRDEILARSKGNAEIPMTVASDRDVELERFLKLMTFLKSQDFKRVDILMKKE